MVRKILFSKTNLFMVFLLCFCIPFSLMFYRCLIEESNYNLRIDRGFVSSSAVYFSFESTQPTEGGVSSGNVFFPDRSLRDAIRVLDDEPYLFASQRKYVRAVCFQKDMDLPPIQEGRFFSSEECWSANKLAVIGRTAMKQTWIREDTGERMISLDSGDYKVVGVAGTGEVSTIDDLIFINIGSLEPEDILTGVFYLDTMKNSSDNLLRRFSSGLSAVSTLSVREIDMPPTASDVVSGGVFFSAILKYSIYGFLLVTFLCLLVFFLVSNRGRMATCMLNGHSYFQSVLRVSVPVMITGLAGLVLAIIFSVIMARFSFFKLPENLVYGSVAVSSLIGLLALIMFPVGQYAVIRRIDLAEKLR